MALSWLYWVALVNTIGVAVSFVVILFSSVDVQFKIYSLIGAVVAIAFLWIQTMIYAPFYSYMSMRAHQVLEVEQK